MKIWTSCAPWAAALLLVCGSANAQETPKQQADPSQTASVEASEEDGASQAQRVVRQPVNLNPERPKFVPVLRERKMTEDELFAHRHGIPLDGVPLGQAPAYASAGERSVGPGGTVDGPDGLGAKIDVKVISRLNESELESFAEKRYENIAQLQSRMEAALFAMRHDAETNFDGRATGGAQYRELRRDVGLLQNEVANLEAAYVELGEFESLDTLQDMHKRLERARVHLHGMSAARDVKEFDSSASVMATALGIIAQQQAALASK